MTKRCIVGLLTSGLCLTFSISGSVLAEQINSPNSDIEPPTIFHDSISYTIVDDNRQIISAKVTDNAGINEVVLYFRTTGRTAYRQVNMQHQVNSDVYAASLGNSKILSPNLDYYIEAVDISGNYLSFGYSFAPIRLSSTSFSQNDSQEKTLDDYGTSADIDQLDAVALFQKLYLSSNQLALDEDSSDETQYKKWLYRSLGVLLIGALTSADDAENSEENQGTLIVTTPMPQRQSP